MKTVWYLISILSFLTSSSLWHVPQCYYYGFHYFRIRTFYWQLPRNNSVLQCHTVDSWELSLWQTRKHTSSPHISECIQIVYAADRREATVTTQSIGVGKLALCRHNTAAFLPKFKSDIKIMQTIFHATNQKVKKLQKWKYGHHYWNILIYKIKII